MPVPPKLLAAASPSPRTRTRTPRPRTGEHKDHCKTYTAEVLPKMLERAFEERRDVVRGALEVCYMRPNGQLLRGAGRDRRPRQQLVEAINA